mmetsp:Transcript_30051/g.73208  ORF Transcript_30051/g.73208 Transcript_30051/m.73208 type:complete len:86 (-) Transcript_30051:649-906(-)
MLRAALTCRLAKALLVPSLRRAWATEQGQWGTTAAAQYREVSSTQPPFVPAERCRRNFVAADVQEVAEYRRQLEWGVQVALKAQQ